MIDESGKIDVNRIEEPPRWWNIRGRGTSLQENEMRPKSILIPHPCAQCGVSFTPRKNPRQQFCSQDCHYKASRRPIPQRWWEKVNTRGPVMREGLTACWPWTGTQATVTGYGLLGVRGSRYEGAHRIAWELASGVPVPEGMTVCHVCDFRLCVRNDECGIYVLNGIEYPRFGHLFLATNIDNIADMMQKGRRRSPSFEVMSQPGELNPSHKLTAEQVAEIRERYAAGGITQTALGAEFSVDRTTIGMIVRGRSWRQS